MPEVKISRREIFDARKKSFIDDRIPDVTIQRAALIRGTGATVTAGSHRVTAGSVFQMTYLSVQSGSPNMWWAITKTGTLIPGQVNGTVDVGYFESQGAETRIGNITTPVHSFGPGTFNLRLLTPGSAKNFGVAFEGVEL
jgi:hypothetical protein